MNLIETEPRSWVKTVLGYRKKLYGVQNKLNDISSKRLKISRDFDVLAKSVQLDSLHEIDNLNNLVAEIEELENEIDYNLDTNHKTDFFLNAIDYPFFKNYFLKVDQKINGLTKNIKRLSSIN